MTDPLTIAREVLDDERAWAALDPGHHPEGQAAVYRLANAAPTLARAVIDLTAKVELRDKALEAVLELHKPIQASMTSNGGVSDVTVCDHCLDPTWPCQTVAAITTPLEEDHA